jgi:hypothetical protein
LIFSTPDVFLTLLKTYLAIMSRNIVASVARQIFLTKVAGIN